MIEPHRRPVIMQVLPALESGGVERGTIEMVQAIVRAGGCALVASAGGRMTGYVAHNGGRHVLLDMRSRNPLRILTNARRLAALIRRENIDLVHARSRAPAWVARIACARTGAKLVTTWHGLHPENVPGKALYNSALVSGQRVIAISRFIAQRLRDRYKVGDDRLRVIARGADTSAFDPRNIRGDRIQALAEQWGVPVDAAVIMLPARLTAWKGPMLLVDALGQLARGHRLPASWVCLLVGGGQRSGRLARQLLERARTLGIGDNLRFAGHCADMPAAYMLADLVVAPSLRPEPFGRVIIEAQAMERVVVVAGHGGAVETVLDGDTGLVVAPGSASELADAIAVTLDAPLDARAAMGERARTYVLAHFTTQAMQAATLGVYDELLGTQLERAFTYSAISTPVRTELS